MQQLDHLESAIPEVLTELSIVLPSWELDMNRHMMLHMVSAKFGPCLGLRECEQTHSMDDTAVSPLQLFQALQKTLLGQWHQDKKLEKPGVP